MIKPKTPSKTGKPMKATQTAQIRLDPADKRGLPKGGLGLYLIHRLMNEVTYESRDGVNIFRMCKHYKQKAPSKGPFRALDAPAAPSSSCTCRNHAIVATSPIFTAYSAGLSCRNSGIDF